jgi:hypothetical protein
MSVSNAAADDDLLGPALAKLIANCLLDGGGGGGAWEVSHEALCRTLGTYAEQPLALDPLLPVLLVPVIDALHVAVQARAALPLGAAAVLSAFCRVRGEQSVAKLLPHDVVLLSPVCQCLTLHYNDESKGLAAWESVFVLLLWLGQLVLLPFSLVSTLRASTTELVALGKQHLLSRGKPSEAAQWMLARLLTRPDLDTAHLAAFLVWAVELIRRNEGDPFVQPALYGVIARIFALGSRDRLLPLADVVFPLCEWSAAICSPLVRKTVVKMAQRVGLVYLAPRVAPWRYKRGHRTLLMAPSPTSCAEEVAEEEEAADWAVPVQVDRVVHVLLCGLRDKVRRVDRSDRFLCSLFFSFFSFIVFLSSQTGFAEWHLSLSKTAPLHAIVSC